MRPGDILPRLLAEEYALQGSISRLAGENDNFLVVTDSGEKFVYKVADEERPRELIELEHRAVEALAAAELGLGLPRLVPTWKGDIESTLRLDGDVTARGRLVRFVAGSPWHQVAPATPRQRTALGACLARFTKAFSDFDHPAARRTHRWDLTAADRLRVHVALIENLDRRRLLQRAFMLYDACGRLSLDELPQAVIHGDWNDENVLVAGEEIVGLLDFGDCLYNPTVCELAIATIYAVLDEEDPFPAAAEIVAAYHAIRPLEVGELEVLFPLICGRLAASVATASERRRIDPDRSAWFSHEERAWQALRCWMEFDPVAAARRLGEGTDLEPYPGLGRSSQDLLEARGRRFTSSLSVSYEEPLKIVRGRGQYLFDERERPYLDLYNNVCHVGHCHPRVVAAGARQMAVLNTNTRYLYDNLNEYAERLCSTLPDRLQYCFFVNSGSEANELAIRLARTHSGHRDLLVVEGAYHGHTTTMIDISPYKFRGKGGSGQTQDWVHVVPVPDGYRGRFKGQSQDAGIAYGEEAGAVIASTDRPIAGFISESLLSCGGQVIPPAGYLRTVYEQVRRAGGVCIADEVQVGFGRVGRHFWAFELQGVVPDIVVMGKPIGNGHPMSAVVTTAEIAASFAETGMEFFSTFGGNPVSCAIGMAVLDVIEDEGLQENARIVGERLLNGLEELARRHPLIGDVRGMGLFIGIEMVRDRSTLEPAAAEAEWLVNELRRRHILTGTEGIYGNVIKIKPPMVVTEADADWVVDVIDDALAGTSPG